MKLLRVSGEHFRMGQQHAAQARALRRTLLDVIEVRLARWTRAHVLLASRYEEALRRHSPATAEMLDGIANGSDIEATRLWQYAASGWVAERSTRRGGPLAGEGCTALAIAGAAVRNGEPLVAKNRDYYRDHRELQMLCEAAPREGHRWLAVGSIGSPGVFSSGMNDRGLVVADTHVPTRDLGDGIPRYAQMLELLERCVSVPQALELLAAAPASGGGNLVLADATGRLAVCEFTHGRRVVTAADDAVVATNHFTSRAMRTLHLRQAGVFGASVARRALVAAASRRHRPHDPTAVQALLARHGRRESAVCRHAYPTPDSRYGTISSVIYMPRRREIRVTDGWPCVGPYRRLAAGIDFWRTSDAPSAIAEGAR